MKLTLDSIQKGKTPKAPRIVLYGVPGIGKSTFAAQAPNPIFLQTENGLNHLDVAKFPLASTLQDITDALDLLINNQTEYKTLVLDTLDWAERIIFQVVAKENGVADVGEIGYGKGPRMAVPHWNKILSRLDALSERNMAIILLAHSKITKFKSPDTNDYDRYEMDLDKNGASLFVEWADAVMFANHRVFTSTEKGSTTAKGTGNGERILYTERRPAFEAKNRYNLPPEMKLSWGDVVAGINLTYKGK